MDAAADIYCRMAAAGASINCGGLVKKCLATDVDITSRSPKLIGLFSRLSETVGEYLKGDRAM